MVAKKLAKKDQLGQSQRFIEAAKAAGVDESGKKFERALKKALSRKGRGANTSP